jgi:hypothetical protein
MTKTFGEKLTEKFGAYDEELVSMDRTIQQTSDAVLMEVKQLKK